MPRAPPVPLSPSSTRARRHPRAILDAPSSLSFAASSPLPRCAILAVVHALHPRHPCVLHIEFPHLAFSHLASRARLREQNNRRRQFLPGYSWSTPGTARPPRVLLSVVNDTAQGAMNVVSKARVKDENLSNKSAIFIMVTRTRESRDSFY